MTENPTPGALSQEVRDVLQSIHNLSDNSLRSHEAWYAEHYLEIPGAPAPHDLSVSDAGLVAAASCFDIEKNVDWHTFREQRQLEQRKELDRSDIYMPLWQQKTDSNPKPWANDTGSINERGQGLLDMALRLSSPSPDMPTTARLMTFPASNMEYMTNTLDSLIDALPLFVRPMGTDSSKSDFRWSTALCLLGGLGLGCVRYIAFFLANEHEDWQHWKTASDEELTHDIMEAHKMSGYPVGLLRIPWQQLQVALQGQEPIRDGSITPQAPLWLSACVALHIMKHTRLGYGTNDEGKKGYFISVMYAGRHQKIPLAPAGMDQSFVTAVNKPLAAAICATLEIPYNGKKTGEAWQHSATNAALRYLHPRHIMRIKPFDDCALVVKSPVTRRRPLIGNERLAWVNPGIIIDGVASCDMNTGVMDPTARVTGIDVLTHDWSTPEIEDLEYYRSLWSRNMPKVVLPELGGRLIRRLVKNINDLGHPLGWEAIMDAAMVCSLIRRKLGDCVLTEGLSREFPILYILPMGSKEEEATNQGKTTLGRIFAGVIAPGLRESNAGGDAGAPAQRSIASPIEQFGTGFYDEFILPQDNNHILSAYSLALLATGGDVHPGKAKENATGVRLKHPLILCGKISPNRADLTNRSSATFMDQITDETRLSGTEYDNLISGVTPLRVRLSYLRYIKENDLINRFKTLEAVPHPTWRWSCHMAVAIELFVMNNPGTTRQDATDEITAYLSAMRGQMEKQLIAATESGLADVVSGGSAFDLRWYLSQADTMTLQSLESESRVDGMSGYEVLRKIVELDGKRRLGQVMEKAKINEKSALCALWAKLAKNPIVGENGWKIEKVDGATAKARVVSPKPPPLTPPVPPKA